MLKKPHRLILIPLIASALAACDSANSPSSVYEYTTLGAYSADISLDGHYAVIGSQDEGGSLWDIQKNARLFDWNHRKDERSIIAESGFSPEANFAVTANQQDLVLWHTLTGQPEWFWSSPGEILDLAIAADGNFALLGLANHEAVYFDIKNGGIRRTLRHQGRVRSVDLSADTLTALTGSDDYKTTVWDMQSGEAIHQISLNNVIDVVALSPNGDKAFSASNLDTAIIWDTQSGEIQHTLSSTAGLFPKRLSYVAARFSKNGDQLLTGTAAGLIQLWDSSSGSELKRWRAHKRDPYGPTSTSIYAVGFGPGEYYAIGSNGVMNILK
ncbi:WD40 repeat domain-containing protein [Neptunomonas sp.]|uniref:WD40 repeat domain-containing protein n=1 Tax=Neptunomonas sp. TaxID=1971898 RepID=UPI0035690E77